MKIIKSLFLLLVLNSVNYGWTEEYAAETAIRIWDGEPLLSTGNSGVERYEDERVYNVRNPAILPRLAESKNTRHPAVLIFPGGGYQRLAIIKEGETIAQWLNSLGIHAFIVKYRMQEFGAPAPLLDAQQALRLVRNNAKNWNVDANKIGIIGFSAGGHLAASLSQYFDYDFEDTLNLPKEKFPLANVSARPDFAMLIYPVISMRDPYAHEGSRTALLGEAPTPENIAFYSVNENINKLAPPTFVIHASNDNAVPADNSVLYWQALRAANVPVELLLYQIGNHGFGMQKEFGQTSEWPARAAEWLKSIGVLEDQTNQLVRAQPWS